MSSIKIPKQIRWIFGIMVLLLLMMTVYRLAFFYTFRAPDRPLPGSAFLLGFRYDIRFISIIGLITLFLSYLNDPFRYNKLNTFWKFFLSILLLLLLVFLSTDFYHYDYLQQRLNATVLNFLQDAAISFSMI